MACVGVSLSDDGRCPKTTAKWRGSRTPPVEVCAAQVRPLTHLVTALDCAALVSWNGADREPLVQPDHRGVRRDARRRCLAGLGLGITEVVDGSGFTARCVYDHPANDPTPRVPDLPGIETCPPVHLLLGAFSGGEWTAHVMAVMSTAVGTLEQDSRGLVVIDEDDGTEVGRVCGIPGCITSAQKSHDECSNRPGSARTSTQVEPPVRRREPTEGQRCPMRHQPTLALSRKTLVDLIAACCGQAARGLLTSTRLDGDMHGRPRPAASPGDNGSRDGRRSNSLKRVSQVRILPGAPGTTARTNHGPGRFDGTT